MARSANWMARANSQADQRHLESQAATSLVCVDIRARLRQPYREP